MALTIRGYHLISWHDLSPLLGELLQTHLTLEAFVLLLWGWQLHIHSGNVY